MKFQKIYEAEIFLKLLLIFFCQVASSYLGVWFVIINCETKITEITDYKIWQIFVDLQCYNFKPPHIGYLALELTDYKIWQSFVDLKCYNFKLPHIGYLALELTILMALQGLAIHSS